MVEGSKFYKKLIDPESEPHNSIRSHLKRLNRIQVTTAYPFLLRCYEDYAKGVMSADQYCEVLATIENFMIRRFVCGVPSNTLNKIFPLLYSQASAHSASNFVQGVKAVLQGRNYPKDSDFRRHLVDTKLYGEGERREKTKLILETLETASGHKEIVAPETLTIEHIMPQTLSDWWREHLGDACDLDHETCLHTIGNLTLTAYNSELSNSSFLEKKSCFESSHVELNKYFNQLSHWNRESIEKRSNELADQAIKIWGYFGADTSSPEIVQAEAVTGTVPRTLVILDQQFEVKTWREVLKVTLATLLELEPVQFELLSNQYPHFIGRESNRFRESIELGQGFFIEVNLQAKQIYRFCLQATEIVGLSSSDWKVITQSK